MGINNNRNMQTLANLTGKLFMYTLGSYPGMDKILPALLDKRVFSGKLIEFVSLEPATYLLISNLLVSNLVMPIVEYICGAFMVYSLWYNEDFYNLIFAGIYGSIWTAKIPDSIASYMPGYDEYLEANPRAVVVKAKVAIKTEKVAIKTEEVVVKTEEVAIKKTEDKKTKKSIMMTLKNENVV